MFRSKNSPQELDFLQFWKPFVRTFQCLCITHYRVFRPELNNNRHKLYLHRIFFIGMVLAQLSSSYYFFKLGLAMRMQTMRKYNFSTVFVYVNVTSRCSQFFSFIVIPFETFFKRDREHKLFETLRYIDDIFKKKSNYAIDYRTIRCRQMKTTWLYFTIITAIIVSSFFVGLPIDKSEYIIDLLLFLYMVVVWCIRVFQIAFFINILCDYLDGLRILMRRQQHRIKYNPAKWKDIQYCRQIYSNIWLCVKLVGNCFGYSIVLCVVDSGVKIIISGYWVYLNVVSWKVHIMHIR